MELVTPAIGLIFWTTVVFTMLVLLLKKFAWKPILTAVDQRNKSINDSLQQAEKARAEMAELNTNNEKILTQLGYIFSNSILEVLLLAELGGVNPFVQEAVEKQKNFLK